MEDRKKVYFMMGVTASGKSALSLRLAYELGAHRAAIYNCDSVQFYQSVDIGSAKPSRQEMDVVPHQLFSCVSFPDQMTAGKYHELFYSRLNKESAEHIFVVGGTGFYFLVLENGPLQIPAASPMVRDQLESRLQREGIAALYEELKSLDPLSAQKFHMNDVYRVMRALEVYYSTGEPMSLAWERKTKSKEATKLSLPFDLVKVSIAVPKEVLRERLHQRAEAMLARGLIEEVEQHLQEGRGKWWPLSSIGYKETVGFLEGRIATQELLVEQIVQSSLQLAKKQRTWLRSQPDVIWIHARDASSLSPDDLSRFLTSTR